MKTSDPKYGIEDSSFQAAGQEAGLRKLSEDFYSIMDSLPEAQGIRAMHPKDLSVSIDKLALFLCGWLGGPRRFQEKYGPIHIPKRHSHLVITHVEKAAWLRCMKLALEKQDYEADFKTYLLEQLEIPAERIRLVCEKNH